jgi:hypothetical protein
VTLKVTEQLQNKVPPQAKGESEPSGGVRVGDVLVRLGDRKEKVDGVGTQKQGDKQKVEAVSVKEQDSRIYVRSYKADSDDVDWA